MVLDLGHAFFVELLGGDHADFVGAGKVEIVLAVDLAAQAYLKDAAVLQEAFFKGAAKWCAMGILAAEIFVPEIVVSVELDEVHGTAMFFGYGAEDGEADGVVAAYARGAGSGGENWREALLDAAEGVFDGERIDGEIAEVSDAVPGEGIEFEDWIPRANDGGLHADITRAETRAGTIRGAAVEGDADDGDVEFFGLRDVRKAHEGGDAGEPSVFERVNGLRMRQAEDARGLLFWHERGMLGAGYGEVNAKAVAVLSCAAVLHCEDYEPSQTT